MMLIKTISIFIALKVYELIVRPVLWLGRILGIAAAWLARWYWTHNPGFNVVWFVVPIVIAVYIASTIPTIELSPGQVVAIEVRGHADPDAMIRNIGPSNQRNIDATIAEWKHRVPADMARRPYDVVINPDYSGMGHRPDEAPEMWNQASDVQRLVSMYTMVPMDPKERKSEIRWSRAGTAWWFVMSLLILNGVHMILMNLGAYRWFSGFLARNWRHARGVAEGKARFFAPQTPGRKTRRPRSRA